MRFIFRFMQSLIIIRSCISLFPNFPSVKVHEKFIYSNSKFKTEKMLLKLLKRNEYMVNRWDFSHPVCSNLIKICTCYEISQMICRCSDIKKIHFYSTFVTFHCVHIANHIICALCILLFC